MSLANDHGGWSNTDVSEGLGSSEPSNSAGIISDGFSVFRIFLEGGILSSSVMYTTLNNQSPFLSDSLLR